VYIERERCVEEARRESIKEKEKKLQQDILTAEAER
jgi:hypothetical protein